MEKKLAHLGFIQNVVARMNSNSFLVKGWSIALVVGIFALSAKDADHRFIALGYFPIFVFWMMDAFFLRQEHLYRLLYKKVAHNEVSSRYLPMQTSKFDLEVPSIFIIAVTKTLLLFHGSIAGVLLYAMFNLDRLGK